MNIVFPIPKFKKWGLFRYYEFILIFYCFNPHAKIKKKQKTGQILLTKKIGNENVNQKHTIF